VSNVRVRMYRQGLGDCFLLSFGKDGSFTEAAHVLIDCGTLGATTTGVKIKDVVANIALTTKNKTTAKSELALLVATHEHHRSDWVTASPAGRVSALGRGCRSRRCRGGQPE
jgi:hypothetical protein